MTSIKRYVADTNAVISYFNDVFSVQPSVSVVALAIIEKAVNRPELNIRLIIPSIVFVEIYEKWCRNEEILRRIYYDVYKPLTEKPNVELKPVESEVLENLLGIGGVLSGHDLHDKIIVASAMMLECPLITSDQKISQYVGYGCKIPAVIC